MLAGGIPSCVVTPKSRGTICKIVWKGRHQEVYRTTSADQIHISNDCGEQADMVTRYQGYWIILAASFVVIDTNGKYGMFSSAEER